MGLIADLMGSQHLVTLNQKLAWDEATWALMPLAGARVAVLPETSRGLPMHTAKAVTGHDRIAAAPKGGHQIEFVYKGHLIYTTNKQLNLADPGMARRVLTLPFTGKPDVVDENLPDKLRAIRPQIWTHLFELWQEIKGDPFEPPEDAANAANTATGGDWEEWAELYLTDKGGRFRTTTRTLVEHFQKWRDGDDANPEDREKESKKMRRKAPGLGLITAGTGQWKCRLKE